MQYYYYCSKDEDDEALVRLFYNLSSSFFLVFFFLSFSSILLFKSFYFLGSPLFPRNEYEYEYNAVSSEEGKEEEEEEEGYGNGIYGKVEAMSFLDKEAETRMSRWQRQLPDNEEILLTDMEEPWITMESTDLDDQITTNSSVYESPQTSQLDEYHHQEDDDDDDQMLEELTDSERVVRQVLKVNSCRMSLDLKKKRLVEDNDNRRNESYYGNYLMKKEEEIVVKENNNGKYLVFGANELLDRKSKEEEEIFGDSCTVGSTSKSSSEWRSSINCRDSSGTEDPFSSSSRRSCPKWESYTVFQKYDEEMMFLDRITAQKLHETESLRSIKMCPRSISERIVYKLSTINKKGSDVKQNPYHELESAYVAQICLTWEALNWNYKNFVNKKLSSCKRSDMDNGCPGKVAQQFQQFQVLLQRYIENEPYEHGRRPEIYARMRLLAPNLLQVPEFIDSEDEQIKGEGGGGYGSRISSPSFLMIMEDGIRTYMNFLKADKEKPCQIVASFFKRKKRAAVDPTLLQLMKKVNQKKKIKLKDLRRAGKCLRKRKLSVEEEMEILMALIDLKVVSRVLRTVDLSEQQLHWCEAKMSKVRILDGKLHRDSSPLFFPAH
ncbi:uncharacterized protein LOC120088168 [Benincasa hispida]|uniref:uncharacterized protein LOC120088168 n=1 Tax=Benincasa hispida TaxID=102211 RepID=UPI0018FFC220|nr:uncharacterized protein LOC120088168 [Benincasa hispida]